MTENRERSLTFQRETKVTIELAEKGAQAKEWIEGILGEKIKEEDFGHALKDGIILCRTIKALKPDLISKIDENTTISYKMVENMYDYATYETYHIAAISFLVLAKQWV